MFISLSLIIILGLLGGLLFEKIKIPKIVYYLILGILLSPSLLNLIDQELLALSSFLRQITLCIILTRAGLSLNIKSLKKLGRSAIMMCFLPATIEILSCALFAPLILKTSLVESLLVGTILAAVSPAIVVPRMIEIINKKESKKNLGELVLSGASVDDVYVIILFYTFKSMLNNSSTTLLNILNVPLNIILGILIGIIFALIFIFLIKKIKMHLHYKVILLIACSFTMIYLESLLKPYISLSSMLGVMVLGICIFQYNENTANELEKSYKSIWIIFELLLFVLVGASIDLNYALSSNGIKITIIVILGMLLRSLGVFVALIKTNFTFKEKLYIYFSYLPKATVQASIAGICLSENMEIGALALTAGIISILISAPIGAILMDNTKKSLLSID